MSSDISDLHGVFPTPLRWGAETGQLGYGVYDQFTGERGIEVVELGSSAARFAMDLATRERGYGLIRAGLYDMRLSPVGEPPPPWPGDDDFRPAVGCWLWHPQLGELRLETNAALFRNAVAAIWDQGRACKEAGEGKAPVIHFVDRREQLVRSVGRSFWAPIITIVGWLPRDKVFTRPATVAPALVGPSKSALLEHLGKDPARTPRGGKGKPVAREKDSLEEFLDDEIPDLAR
jgi:hypothetical protein